MSDHLVQVPPGVADSAEWIREGCEKMGRTVHVDLILEEISKRRIREIRSWDVMGM
jgi:hypothetical protein